MSIVEILNVFCESTDNSLLSVNYRSNDLEHK